MKRRKVFPELPYVILDIVKGYQMLGFLKRIDRDNSFDVWILLCRKAQDDRSGSLRRSDLYNCSLSER